MPDHSNYCEHLVRDADKDRFLATLFAPADRRPALFAIYAFDLETDAVARRIREPMAGEIRLQWWHEAVSGTADAAGHPVVDALLSAMSRFSLPNDLALGVIEARRRRLYPDEDDTGIGLEMYASDSAGTVCLMAAHVLAGAPGEPVRQACLHAGAATLMTERSAAQRHLSAIKELLADMPAAVLPAFLPLALVRARLDRPELPQWRKQWILWRASRNLVQWL